MPSLGTATLASFWTLGSFGTSQVLRLASNIILARLLFPELFGLMSLVAAIMSGLQSFSDVGLLPSLVRSKRGEEAAFRNTAWTLGVVRGSILWACAALVAIPASLWYDERLLAILPVAGFGAFLASLASTAPAILNRRMKLGSIALLEMTASVVGVGVMCVWAAISPTVWALVVGGLAGTSTRTVLTWRMLPQHRDRFQWDPRAARELLHFGRWIFVSTLITFFAAQADKLLLGRLLPLDQLGLYAIALSLITMPRELVAKLAGAVQFPLLSRTVRDEPSQLYAHLRQTREPLLLVALCMTLAVALGAQAFFATLYDDRYMGAAELCVLLSIPATVWVLSVTLDRVLLALGDSRSLAAANLARAVALVPACMGGYALAGIWGFIGGLTVSVVAGHIVLCVRLKRHGITVIGSDLVWFCGFTAMLTVPIAVSQRLLSPLYIHGVDVGLLACGAVILVPLGVVAAIKLRGIISP